ncbi:MAG: hypothetical protein ABJ215_03125 [Alphaproteobacteria bacterium]
MTEHDQTARADGAKTDPRAPAASLTRVSIRHAARRTMPAVHVETAHAKSAHAETACAEIAQTDPTTIPDKADTSTVIELCADTTPSAPRRAFPSAQTQTLETTGAAARRHAHVAPSAMIDLWEHLAADRLRPNMSDVDPVTIAGQWPNSLLLRVTEGGRRPGLEVAHMFAPTAGGPTSAIPIDAMTVDWIVGLGREVVITGGPVHETDAVPTGAGPINCGVIALPFGAETGVDHVLCHLYRVDDRVVEGEIDAEHSLPPRDRTGIKRLFGR